MAKEKKLVQSITSRDEDFAQWYTDVVREAKLCDYSGVKGCLNYLPNGYALWENIQADLDKRFKDTGVENVYLPVLIPESLLQKEKDHIEGFAPEVAWVTHGGMEQLQERFCIRPTSETLFCDVWSKTVQSYRDLPKVWNQWCVPPLQRVPVAGGTYDPRNIRGSRRTHKDDVESVQGLRGGRSCDPGSGRTQDREREIRRSAGYLYDRGADARRTGAAVRDQPFLRKCISGCV